MQMAAARETAVTKNVLFSMDALRSIPSELLTELTTT
jgi:hypothetical protein